MINSKKIHQALKITAILPFLALFNGLVHGQVQEEIEIVKSYKPELTDAVKIDVNPEDPELDLQKPDLSYTPEPVFLDLDPTQTQLPGVSLGQQQLDPLRHSHFKVGGGNFANAIIEGTYNTKRNKDQTLAAYARHHSGKGPVNKSNFSEQVLRLKGKQLYENVTIKARPFFQRNRYHRYGFDDGENLDKADIQQDYIRYGMDATLQNKRADTGKLRYSVTAKGQNLNATNNAAETDASIRGKVQEGIGNNAARIDAKYRFLDYRSSSGNYQRNVIKFGGRYIFKSLGKGKAELGFRTASIVDITDEPFHFYPYMRLSYALIPDTLTIFGGLKGALKPQTYSGLTNINPYVRSDAQLRNTNEQFTIYAGAKGNIGKNLDFLTRLSFKNIENMPLYVNGDQVQRQFVMRYDTAITTVVRLKAELNFQLDDQFNLGLKMNLRDFNMGSRAHPWHRPALDYQVEGRYSFGKKIRLRASINGFGQRKALTYDQGSTGSKNLDAILDMNTGIDYRFSKTFTAFFNFRNLLNTEYQYWNQYPVRGFHFTGGLKMNVFR